MPTTGWTSRLASSSFGGAERELVVGAVHRVAGLEGDDLPPAALGELLAELGRRVAQRAIVVVQRRLQRLDLAADVDRLALVHQVADGRVRLVVGAEDGLRFGLAVGSPDVFDVDHGEHHALGVAQRDLVALLELVGEFLGDVERDRHRPERAVLEPHLVADRVVVGLAHEAGERREAAVAQELEVAQLPRREVPGGPVARLRLDFGGAFGRDGQIDEGAPMRGNQMAGHAVFSLPEVIDV